MTDSLNSILAEYAALEAQLADPTLMADQSAYRLVSKRYGGLGPLAAVAKELLLTQTRLDEAKTLLNDPDLGDLARADLAECETKLPVLIAQFEDLSLPKDEADARDVIVEIRAGTGGTEAALFAADLYRIYERFAAQNGFALEALDSSDSELGGFSKVTFEVRGHGAYGRFKFESGVHRVQRVPATEAQGRIHTSTATVAVLPEAEDVDVQLDPNDVRIDVYRSGGNGGQGVNTTDSAVRLTYRAGTSEEIVVTCQDGRSQLKNKDKAFAVLRARLYERERERSQQERSQARASQIGTGERSEKIRTYNYPQNRVTDHRLEGEHKNAPLESVIAGELGGLVDALAQLEREQLLSAHLSNERVTG